MGEQVHRTHRQPLYANPAKGAGRCVGVPTVPGRSNPQTQEAEVLEVVLRPLGTKYYKGHKGPFGSF
jgi:hypothetical protein